MPNANPSTSNPAANHSTDLAADTGVNIPSRIAQLKEELQSVELRMKEAQIEVADGVREKCAQDVKKEIFDEVQGF